MISGIGGISVFIWYIVGCYYFEHCVGSKNSLKSLVVGLFDGDDDDVIPFDNDKIAVGVDCDCWIIFIFF